MWGTAGGPLLGGRLAGGPAARPCRAGRARLGPRADRPGPGLWERGGRHCGPPRGSTRVVAHDIDPVALAIAAKNATANAVDLHLRGTPLLHGPCPERITCILVGDLFYERSEALVLWAWLCTARRRGVQVLIADASRPFAPTVGVRCLREERLATAWAWEGTHTRTVRLLTLDA